MHQTTIGYHMSGTISTFNNINENANVDGLYMGTKNDIMDKELTAQERIEIYKTLAYNFFNDNTFFLSYYIQLNKVPPYDYVCAQYGFFNCRGVEEKYNLIMLYKICFEKCYPDLFIFKTLQLLHEYFCQDRIADFILQSYGRISYTDKYLYWFLERQYIVKHHLNYNTHLEKKKRLFQK